MWDMLEFLLSFFIDSLDLIDAFYYWRFSLCVLGAGLLLVLVTWLLPNLARWFSVPVLGTGIAWGAGWEWKSRKP
jgi:hypothetical protein